MPRLKKHKASQNNLWNARARRWLYRHQAQTDQQQTGSSEQSSSEIVGNVVQHFPRPLQQFDTHSSTFEAKPNLSKIETQSATPPRFESTDFLFNTSSEHISSEIEEIGFQHFLPPQPPENHSSTSKPNLTQVDTQPSSPQSFASTDSFFEDSFGQTSPIVQNVPQHFPPPQQSEDQSSSLKPNLSHIEPKPNSPHHSTRTLCSFKSSSEHLSSSSTSSDILGKARQRQQSKIFSSTSKPNLPHTEQQPTSSNRSARKAFLGRTNFNENNFESITANCANCNWRFEDEIERNVKFNLLNSNNNDIQIIDAIFSIYGLTVADWSQTLTSDEEDGSVFAYVSEHVFEKGISFCSDCSLALQNVYTSHQTLKKFSHNESLFTKALNTQSSCKMQIKTEEGDENEILPTNDRKTEGLVQNELEDELSCFEPMMDEHFDIEDPLEDNLDALQPSLFTHFLLSNETVNVTKTRYDLPRTNVRSKAKSTTNNSKPKRKRRPPGKRDIKFKTEQKYLALTDEEPLWSLNEIKELNKRLRADGFLEENLRDCFVRIEQMPPDPYGSIYSFNALCCGTTFYTNGSFIRHQLIMHKEDESSQKLAKCGICERSISVDNMVKHMRTILYINGKDLNCSKCDMKFKHRCGLLKHFKIHDPNHVSRWCDNCEIHLKSEYYSIVHKVLKHSETSEAEKVFPCDKCDAKFVQLHLFRHHYGTHSPAEDRTCKICDMVFVTPTAFYKHCKLKHKELTSGNYVCEICNLRFKKATNYQNHKERNICTRLNQRLVCEKCGKDFRNSNSLKSHMQQHEDIENPNKESFKCPICEKTLKHRLSLQVHIRREHPKEPKKLLYCEKCGKTTKNWSNMRIHMKVHENKE